MKKLSGVVGVLILLVSGISALAIEGLQLSVQSSNVILSWPSRPDETYIVQYRPTLDTNSSWLTLTDTFPAAVDTNFTFFIHSNAVNYAELTGGGGTNGGGDISPSGLENSETASAPFPIMAMPADGSAAAVPLALYPIGFDLSGLVIFDPTTEEWISGKGYSMRPIPAASTQTSGVQPMDLSSDTNYYTGFYRVVRDGAHLWGITNGMVISNILVTVLEIAVDSTDQIAGVTFYDENHSPITGASAQSLDGNRWLMIWNTTMEFNGDYTIYAELNFASAESVVGQPVAVTVNNLISFPNAFSQVYGNQMWIYAQTIPDAAYEVDLYDENTNYLGSFGDYADGNGTISFVWNLVDGNDITHEDTNFFGVFTVDTSSLANAASKALTKSLNPTAPRFQTASLVKKALSSRSNAGRGVHPDGSDSSASASQMWSKEGNWTPNNKWVVAYGLFNGQSGESSQNDVYMITGGPSGTYGGVLGTLDQYGLNGNISPENSAINGTVFTVQDQSSRTNLLRYLSETTPQYENFYFFGHGNSSAIGSYNGYTLTKDQIGYALGNVTLRYENPKLWYGFSTVPAVFHPTINPQMQRTALHPYRFVFIDACDTGAGKFCEAFGIPSLTVSTNYFATAGVESRAFVGMYKWKLNLNFIGWQGYSAMTSQFLGNWLSGVDLQTCVGNAQSSANGTGAQMSSSAVIYGAYDLKIDTHTRSP